MDKQVFAKFGVFVLLGLNVGAYYVFWPHQNGGAKSEGTAPRESKGAVQLLPAQPQAAKPKELPAKSVADAVPLNIPLPPRLPEGGAESEDVVGKLLSRIKEQNEGVKDKPPISLPMPAVFDEQKIVLPGFPMDNKPNPLPPLKGEPVLPVGVDPKVGVTSPLSPKVPEGRSPWTFKVENAAQGQKLVIAKLDNPSYEFRIYCDSFTEKQDGAEFEATGVLLDSSGVGVRCKRLTVPVGQPPRIVFEGDVLVDPDAPFGSSMSANRLVWELHPMPLVRPAALGGPK